MTTINENLFQALSLDLSILEVLLKRHRCSHGRAIYFRRTSMALRATQRFRVLETGEQLKRFEKMVIEYCQKQKRKRHRSNGDDDQWDIRGGSDDDKSTLQRHYEALEQLYTEYFAEILSRIDHASAPLFLEVGRGFFLPFCTVALGTLARIRVVILRIGRYGLSKLQEIVSSNQELRKFLSFSKEMIEATMTKYLDNDQVPSWTNNSGGVGMVSQSERLPTLLKSLGYCMPKLSNSGANNGSISEEAVFSGNNDLSIDSKQKVRPESRSATHRSALQDDDDTGESVTFSRDTGNRKIAKDHSAANAQFGSVLYASDQLDRNMELVVNFKNRDKKRGFEKGGDDKKSKKCHEKEASSARNENKERKKKKKKRNVDFFDALFG